MKNNKCIVMFNYTLIFINYYYYLLFTWDKEDKIHNKNYFNSI